MDCLFCKIIAGEVPAKKVFEDDQIFAFHDISPQAPVHVLIIPKKHISTINDINKENSGVISHIFETIPQIAKQLHLDNGYRVVSNCLEDGGQTVHHVHFHLIGGKKLGWTPD